MQRGKFITFEGIDGCGKTTQLRLLERYLAEQAIPFISTREPGGTPLGTRIRAVLLEVSEEPVEPLAELLLYAADRAQHVRQLILPTLARGKVVLCDRYSDATIAYQGYGRGFDLPLVEQLMNWATDGLKPDLTLLFDLDVRVGLNRVHRRSHANTSAQTLEQPDRLDLEPAEFHERVRQGYLAIAARAPERFRLISAAGSIETVAENVFKEVEHVLSNANPH
jgi:dTMP kinase